jgi:hypothetical protein
MSALTRSNLASRRSARRDRVEAKHHPEVVFEAGHSASAGQMGTLAQQGFRFVRRGTVFTWVHPTEVLAADQDCTAMGDAEFERVAAEAEQQALAIDRARNDLKPTPAYYERPDLFSLSQQNRGVL